MKELITQIIEVGITVVILALFIYDWIDKKKNITKILNEIKNSNQNTSRSLEILEKSMENQTTLLLQQDKKSDEILNIVKKKGSR